MGSNLEALTNLDKSDNDLTIMLSFIMDLAVIGIGGFVIYSVIFFIAVILLIMAFIMIGIPLIIMISTATIFDRNLILEAKNKELTE